MASEDDTAYKQLFAYPEMVRDLLLGFVPGEWVRQLDLDSFERINGSYVSDGGHHRHSDMVWRVRLAGEWIYIYLLLEFQSRSDHWMALRMQVYIGLLYQDLIKRHELPQPGKLPPVFPIVLYNDKKRWKASLSLADLITAVPSDLWHLQAAQRYLLIDQHRLRKDELDLVNNFAAMAFRVERTRTVPDLATELDKLQYEVVTDSVQKGLGRWGARHLRRLAGERMIHLQSAIERSAVMATPEFKTYGDIFRYEAELFGHKDRLKILLAKRFGKLSRKLSSRIDWAEREDVDLWFDRIFEAKNIQEIFAENQPA
ncbi:hypothetical protein D0T25_22340 [Duganella sp. BJB488]|uniref:Rpn family recombination-promoting nuclease/putative transposase n=1 Tax=unclassified Duganella TaxID=2636909 RepID=UPI000E341AB2|nr:MULTISPECIES: Rpn family recombination-promoting nuclease/putative transposase [unclassified Duganella]RFP14097.1 hypothetical protein D0T26_22240 [Duganella sp. BJB489]RFP17321.1 hypothetical protein D0T25_22340 [Duganella sp. BJB488]RFP31891.1 hypothetical protein D0T24_23580 [Duganella sp. BJB480]